MYLNHYAAQMARNRALPWKVRIEFVGRNGENASGYSSKFWMASGTGQGPVEIRWGKIGGSSSSLVKDWAYVQEKLPKKLNEGYRYASGTQTTLDPVAAKPAPAAPKPAPMVPVVPALVASQPTTLDVLKAITANPTRLAGLPSAPVAPHLPGPFGLVAGLRAVKTGFEALDAKGSKLMLLTFDGGRQLSQEHNVPVLGLGV